MTLILTELSSLGIVMAADSAVTYTHRHTNQSFVFPNNAQKLQFIPHLNAGISCWGLGNLGGLTTDQWTANFISTNIHLTNLKDFADELAKQLNILLPQSPVNNSRIGFHLAGYENYNGQQTPSFYHIHEGASTTLQQRGITINPSQFNANHDVPPNIYNQIISTGRSWITRNGDYILYANIFQLLENFFNQLAPLGIIIPNSQNINERAEYLVFQIKTIAEIYRLSNLPPGIGGGIYYLTINTNGIQSHGVKY